MAWLMAILIGAASASFVAVNPLEVQRRLIKQVSVNKQALRGMNTIKFDSSVKRNDKLDLLTQRFHQWIFQIQSDVIVDEDACNVVEEVFEIWTDSSRSFNQAFILFSDLKSHQNDKMRELTLSDKCGQILFTGAVNHGNQNQTESIFDYFAAEHKMNIISNDAMWKALDSQLYQEVVPKYFDHWFENIRDGGCGIPNSMIFNRVLQIILFIPNSYQLIIGLVDDALEINKRVGGVNEIFSLDTFRIVFNVILNQMKRDKENALMYVADACKQYRYFLESKLEDPGKEIVRTMANVLFIGNRSMQSVTSIIRAIEQDVDAEEFEQADHNECCFDS